MIDPRTNDQWQEAVDAAEFCLALDSARQYGLIQGGPKVDVVRAIGLLTLGRSRGITPRPGAIAEALAQLDAMPSTVQRAPAPVQTKSQPDRPPQSPPKPLTIQPTKARPKTPEKIEVMRQRVEAGLPLAVPADGPEVDLS